MLDHAGDLTVQITGTLPRRVHRPLLDPCRVPGLLRTQPAAGVPGGGPVVRAVVAVLRRPAVPGLRYGSWSVTVGNRQVRRSVSVAALMGAAVIAWHSSTLSGPSSAADGHTSGVVRAKPLVGAS
jgi:hypothetical protein